MRDAGTSTFVCFHRTLWCRDSRQAGTHEADIGSFLCCSGDSLQEQCTRAVHTGDHFVPASSRTNSNQPNFMNMFRKQIKLWPRNRTFCKNGHATRGTLSLNAPASSHASAACPLVFVDLNGFPEADATCVALISVLCLFPVALMMWTRQEWFLHQPGAASGKMNTICCLLLHIS